MKFGNHIDLSLSELQNALIQKLGSDPTGQASRIYYNTSANVLKYHNGTEWVSLNSRPTFAEVINAPGGGGGFYDGTETFDITTEGNFFVASDLEVDFLASTVKLRGSTHISLQSDLIKLPNYDSNAADGTAAKTLGVTATGDLVKFTPAVSDLQAVTDVGNVTTNTVTVSKILLFDNEIHFDDGMNALPLIFKTDAGSNEVMRLQPANNGAHLTVTDDLILSAYTGAQKDDTPVKTLGVDATGKVVSYTPEEPETPNLQDVMSEGSTATVSTPVTINSGSNPLTLSTSGNINIESDTNLTIGTSADEYIHIFAGNNVDIGGELNFNSYGTNSPITGTIETILAVESGGKVIETTVDEITSGFVKLVEADQTITGNLTIDGNFTVTGANVLTAPETVLVEDNLLYLNSNWGLGSAPTQDAGFLINRGLVTEAGEDTVGLIWDETNNIFVFGSYGTEDGTGTTLTHTTQVDILAANAEFSGLTINTATTEMTSPSGTEEVLVRDSSTGEVKHVNFSEFGSVNRATGTITGDDSNKDFVITHNLGVQLVQVQIFNASSPFEMIITDIELTNANSATIKFAQNVPTGTSYNVIVIG